MDKIGDMSVAAGKTRCPGCGGLKLDFLLRCDLNYGGCLYTANCPACGSSMEIVLSDSEPDEKELTAAVAPCPKCGDTARTATLHCEVSSRSCLYTLECATCASA